MPPETPAPVNTAVSEQLGLNSVSELAPEPVFDSQMFPDESIVTAVGLFSEESEHGDGEIVAPLEFSSYNAASLGPVPEPAATQTLPLLSMASALGASDSE